MGMEKLYPHIDPILERIHGVLYNFRAQATYSTSDSFYRLECNYKGLTSKQEEALLDLVIGFVEGFNSYIGGAISDCVVEGLTRQQVDVLLDVIASFVRGFGGVWVGSKSEVYSE